jgi:CRISPR system Cascade subunit CasD
MTAEHNTLFLRLTGPMQSWGTSSRFQLRRTDAYPSKSGVLGLLLCAKGIRRELSEQALSTLTPLLMGVRVDLGGTFDWDYHTAGAKTGIRRADGKGPKVTESTGKLETLLSRRQYLYDASFLVALQGDKSIILDCAHHLQDPIWPSFLGRKCCVPSEPVFAGTGSFQNLTEALSSIHWRARIDAIDRSDRATTRTLDVYLEQPPGSSQPPDGRLVYDVPRVFGFWSHSPRWTVKISVTVPVGRQIHYLLASDRASGPDRDALCRRLAIDHHLCVFCKAPAEEVHHVTYENYGHESDADLRSLCRICHLACSQLEYGHDMRRHRVDPSDPGQRQIVLSQIKRILAEQRLGQRRELLRTARIAKSDFFDAAAGAAPDGGR